MSAPERGVTSLGLKTTALPARSAGTIVRSGSATGKFHGMMTATTPRASRWSVASLPGYAIASISTSSGSSSSTMLRDQYCTTSAVGRTSPSRASTSGLPTSSRTSAAMACARPSTRSLSGAMRFTRSSTESAAHADCAARARATTSETFVADVVSVMGVRAYSRRAPALRFERPSMRPALLLALLAAIGCSRGAPAADDPPRTPGASGNIPAAASSARLDTTQAEASAPDPTASSWPLPSPSSPPGSVVRPPPPRIREDGATLSSAGLPIEVVRRIVRQNFGRFRLCYESGLRLDPTLAGAVRVRFVVETDGAVGTVNDAGSTLPDAGVVACIERAFGNLSFPEPTGGALSVTYSLSFSTAP
jgi:hypothetical protein